MTTSDLNLLSSRLGDLLLSRNLFLTVAESCTGGWLGQSITSVEGSSRWFGFGFVTYSNEAKNKILGVSQKTLRSYGAVSEQVVEEMVSGAILKSDANLGVAISGIAGPEGGSGVRPVGTVCFSWMMKGSEPESSTEFFYGDRNQVRKSSVERALLGTINIIERM